MFRVQLVGLMYFHGCTLDVKRAYVPNGTKGEPGIPPHHASFFVDADLCSSDDWWPGQKFDHALTIVDDQGNEVIVHVLEFRIPEPAEVTFPDSGDDKAEFVNLETALPKLQTINPKFQLDMSKPETIAQFPIRGGKLESFGFNGAEVVQWTVGKHSGPIVIEVRGRDKTQTITLKEQEGAEIVFSNTSDLIKEGRIRMSNAKLAKTAIPAPSHFSLYAKLDVHRDANALKELPGQSPVLKPLVPNDAYLRFLLGGTELPDYPCSPTCCS